MLGRKKMAIDVTFLLATTLLVVSLTVNAQGYGRSPFSEQVLKNLPKTDYKQLFNSGFQNAEEYQKALNQGMEEFQKAFGQSIPIQQYIDRMKQYNNRLSPMKRFKVYTNALANILEKNQALTQENMSEMAAAYTDLLRKSAMSMNNGDFMSSMPAIANANAEFFKYAGLATQNLLEQYYNNLLEEAEKM